VPIISVRLDLAGGRDAPRNFGAAFGRWRKGEVGGGYARDFNVQVDAIEQRTRDPRLIICRAARSAAASERGIAELRTAILEAATS